MNRWGRGWMACCKAENIYYRALYKKKIDNHWIMHVLTFRSSDFENQHVNNHWSTIWNRKILETKCLSLENWLIMINPHCVIPCTPQRIQVNVYMLTGKDFLVGLGLKSKGLQYIYYLCIVYIPFFLKKWKAINKYICTYLHKNSLTITGNFHWLHCTFLYCLKFLTLHVHLLALLKDINEMRKLWSIYFYSLQISVFTCKHEKAI